jgi:excisionase family DNA binding protein
MEVAVMNESKLLSVAELAELLGISDHTVYAWVSKGRLPCVKLGTRTMFDPREIERWIGERSRREGFVGDTGSESKPPGCSPAAPMP